MELDGKKDRAKKIDSYTLWVYPALYIVGGILLYVYFLLPEFWDAAVQDVSQTFGLS
jgi:hypothetical protein